MQAYAEGFSILQHKREFGLDLHQVAEIWRHGSVVRSWLLDLTAAALEKNPALDGIAPYVDDSGEGRWTVAEAIELDVSGAGDHAVAARAPALARRAIRSPTSCSRRCATSSAATRSRRNERTALARRARRRGAAARGGAPHPRRRVARDPRARPLPDRARRRRDPARRLPDRCAAIMRPGPPGGSTSATSAACPARRPSATRGWPRLAWLDHVPIPAAQLHPIPAELGPQPAAAAYAAELRNVGDFDLVLLGLGEDGHTAVPVPWPRLGRRAGCAGHARRARRSQAAGRARVAQRGAAQPLPGGALPRRRGIQARCARALARRRADPGPARSAPRPASTCWSADDDHFLRRASARRHTSSTLKPYSRSSTSRRRGAEALHARARRPHRRRSGASPAPRPPRPPGAHAPTAAARRRARLPAGHRTAPSSASTRSARRCPAPAGVPPRRRSGRPPSRWRSGSARVARPPDRTARSAPRRRPSADA